MAAFIVQVLMSQDYNSDSDSSYNFDDWDNDGETESSSAPGLSMLVPQGFLQGTSQKDDKIKLLISMGFTEEEANLAISRCGLNSDVDVLVDFIASSQITEVGSSMDPQFFLQGMPQKDGKVKLLVNMGFTEEEADQAISRCGLRSDIDILVVTITSSQMAEVGNFRDAQIGEMVEVKKKRKRCERGGARGSRASRNDGHDDMMPIPNPMKGFILPNDRVSSTNRRLLEQATGPPYFYYEVVPSPKDTWDRISRFLDNIVPEFLDSKYMCAISQERGYIHNLPSDNRSPLLPLPQKTIFGVFPHSQAWWPCWDKRTQFDSLQTCMASPELLEHIRSILACCDDVPLPQVVEYVMEDVESGTLYGLGSTELLPWSQMI